MNPTPSKNLVKRYVKAKTSPNKTFMDPQPVMAKVTTTPAPQKPKLIVQGRNAYYQNSDGTRSPYKKNIVDKLVDRVLSPY